MHKLSHEMSGLAIITPHPSHLNEYGVLRISSATTNNMNTAASKIKFPALFPLNAQRYVLEIRRREDSSASTAVIERVGALDLTGFCANPISFVTTSGELDIQSCLGSATDINHV